VPLIPRPIFVALNCNENQEKKKVLGPPIERNKIIIITTIMVIIRIKGI
jgi:hypothetical protein